MTWCWTRPPTFCRAITPRSDGVAGRRMAKPRPMPVARAGRVSENGVAAARAPRGKEAKKITLKHGDIKNLDMPGMTMVFQVKDASLLDKVKAGDKVKFAAEKTDSAIVVTAIEPVK
jgi:Cu/Ag efflux protein CusF